MPFKVLIVDDEIYDEENAISALPELLLKAGYEVKTVSDKDAAWDVVWNYLPDLVVLDIQFGTDTTYGIELCKAIRLEGSEAPIILVTAVRKETEAILRGFEAGANDYVLRPRQGNEELMARIRANLPPEVVIIDDYMRVDFVSRKVWVVRNGAWRETHLSPLLWRLLETLVINAGLIVPTTSIKDRVYGKAVGDSALFKAVHDLRRKLEPDPSDPVYIKVVTGIGYRFSGSLVRAGADPSKVRHANPPEQDGVHSSLYADDVCLKSRLMAHTEEVIDRLLNDRGEENLKSSQVERFVRAVGQCIVERFANVII